MTDTRSARALRAVLREFDGRPILLARAIGDPIQRQHVEAWVRQGYVPPTQCPRLEAVTRGRYTCEQLSAKGVNWARIPDALWPWHPQGRPVVDVSRNLIAPAEAA